MPRQLPHYFKFIIRYLHSEYCTWWYIKPFSHYWYFDRYMSLVDPYHVVGTMNPIKYWSLIRFQPTVPKYDKSKKSSMFILTCRANISPIWVPRVANIICQSPLFDLSRRISTTACSAYDSASADGLSCQHSSGAMHTSWCFRQLHLSWTYILKHVSRSWMHEKTLFIWNLII